jgi:hypothetical protein
MNTTAYVIARIVRIGLPPEVWVLTNIGIFSESGLTLTGGWSSTHFAADMFQAHGHDYESAKENAIQVLAERCPWARPFLSVADQSLYDSAVVEDALRMTKGDGLAAAALLVTRQPPPPRSVAAAAACASAMAMADSLTDHSWRNWSQAQADEVAKTLDALRSEVGLAEFRVSRGRREHTETQMPRPESTNILSIERLKAVLARHAAKLKEDAEPFIQMSDISLEALAAVRLSDEEAIMRLLSTASGRLHDIPALREDGVWTFYTFFKPWLSSLVGWFGVIPTDEPERAYDLLYQRVYELVTTND